MRVHFAEWSSMAAGEATVHVTFNARELEFIKQEKMGNPDATNEEAIRYFIRAALEIGLEA